VGAAQFWGKLQQVMFTAGLTATGVQTGDILDALRLTSSDGADSTIVAARAALAAVCVFLPAAASLPNSVGAVRRAL
jgi:hypothetical protein